MADGSSKYPVSSKRGEGIVTVFLQESSLQLFLDAAKSLILKSCSPWSGAAGEKGHR